MDVLIRQHFGVISLRTSQIMQTVVFIRRSISKTKNASRIGSNRLSTASRAGDSIQWKLDRKQSIGRNRWFTGNEPVRQTEEESIGLE